MNTLGELLKASLNPDTQILPAAVGHLVLRTAAGLMGKMFRPIPIPSSPFFTSGINLERKNMKYRLLGNSGLRVSEVALGTMTFGEDWGWGASKEEAQKVYNAFCDAGGNFIDTARIIA